MEQEKVEIDSRVLLRWLDTQLDARVPVNNAEDYGYTNALRDVRAQVMEYSIDKWKRLQTEAVC